MCEITVYIGDNASGKTRKSIEHAIGGKLNIDKEYSELITNIPYIKTKKVLDVKRNKLLKSSDYVEILEHDIDMYGVNKVKTAANMLVNVLNLSGKVLLIDELDSIVDGRYTVLITNFIRENKHLWNKVILNGYSSYILNVFGDEPTNIMYVTRDNKVRKVTEQEAYEILDNLQ